MLLSFHNGKLSPDLFFCRTRSIGHSWCHSWSNRWQIGPDMCSLIAGWERTARQISPLINLGLRREKENTNRRHAYGQDGLCDARLIYGFTEKPCHISADRHVVIEHVIIYNINTWNKDFVFLDAIIKDTSIDIHVFLVARYSSLKNGIC